MSDRINYLTVTLAKDTRDDDCEPLINAIRMLKGVLDVTPNVASVADHCAVLRAKHEIREQIEKIVWD